MILDDFETLPDNARLWIYGFEKTLNMTERSLVAKRLSTFMDEWRSHNEDVDGAFVILHDRFAVLSGASRGGLSGCSIDSSVENFKAFRDRHGLDALNRDLIFYRGSDGGIKALARSAFKVEVDTGRCGPETTVFDLTIGTLADLRSGRFEVPLADAWHAKVFLPA